MFLFRAIFWLGVVVMILPPAADGTPPPRVSVLATLSATRALARDISGACERNPHACEIGADTITLLKLKAKTGIDVIGGAIASYQGQPETGTLTDRDLIAEWAASDQD
jgi:hypothetical protein